MMMVPLHDAVVLLHSVAAADGSNCSAGEKNHRNDDTDYYNEVDFDAGDDNPDTDTAAAAAAADSNHAMQ